MAEVEKYSMRNAISVEEVRSMHIFQAVKEKWSPAIDDPQVFYSTDPSGFFVGELYHNGIKSISCISVVKYGEQFAFLGFYVVDKLYRGKGFGLALFQHAMGSLSPTHNCGLDAVLDKVPLYEKWGFKSTWINRKVNFDVVHCASLLHKFIPPTDVVVHLAKEVDQDLLSAYDTTAFGAPHNQFMKALLETSDSINLAATDSTGDIVGFVSARKMILEIDGWSITPLFADNGQIARALLREIYLKLAKDWPERKVALMGVPVDINPEAKALVEELDGTKLYDLNRMFTKGAPEIPKEKVFSFVSTDLG